MWALLTNPNVIYALLIIGLWAAAAAFKVPGTGLLETAAFICLALTVVGLTRQPPNVVGVVLILVAGVLFVVDLKVQSIALTLGAVVSLVLGSVFLFPRGEAGPEQAVAVSRISPWLIGGVTLASLSFFGLALSAVARVQRIRTKVSADAIVGQRCVARTPIDPLGTIQLQSELWTAIADEEESIGVGEEVEVMALEGLKARVRRVNAAQDEGV